VNSRAFEYTNNPIKIKAGEPVRVYLLNMIEFDPVNSFHLHSGMFNYTASGTENTPSITTDIVTIGQGDREIIEFTPKYTGQMMIYAHINEFTALGWNGNI
jgi:FtsP/CotA-like multicopper oxidase with cupredoxin domain